MKEIDSTQFWEKADSVKRRIFNRLWKETRKIDFLNYKNYRKKFEDIPSSLLEEWGRIEGEYKDYSYQGKSVAVRWKGFLFEALFYYACLNAQTIFLDAEIIEFGGEEPYFDEYPPWFGALPLYDIIPDLHHIREKGKRKRKVPQTKADFLVQYVDDSGPLPPALIDIKSSKPQRFDEAWSWQITAAMRRGFIFQIAYPKQGVEHPKMLEEWEIETPCSNCRKLSSYYRQCTHCRKEIFLFTIADAYYKARELREKLGKNRKGRF